MIHILTFNETFHSLVSSGKLRPDFADRFNGTKITIPPLRDRKEDIPNIIFGTINQSDNPVDYITQEALDFLISMEFKKKLSRYSKYHFSIYFVLLFRYFR